MISGFISFDLVEIKAGGGQKKSHNAIRLIEGERLADYYRRKAGHRISLDCSGKTYNSMEFSRWLDRRLDSGNHPLQFLLGGKEGLSTAVIEDSDTVLSLSLLTFPHELARIILLEQLYRALTITKGLPYSR